MLNWNKDGQRPVAQSDGNGGSYVDMIHAVANFVGDWIVRPINVWLERQSLYEELGSQSDRILADLGINRANIRATVDAAVPYSKASVPADDRAAVAPAVTAPVASNDQENTPLAA